MFKAIYGILAATMIAGPVGAVTVVQAGDPGVSQGGATPITDATAMAFEASNPSTFLEDFEDAAASGFSISGGSITSSPNGGGSSVFGFNTTPGGRFLFELVGGSASFAFLNPISSFGFNLTGVQLSSLSVAFNDGTAQNISIINNGSGVQFFGASGFANPIIGFTFNATNDIVGIDDFRFSAAPVLGAVPEPATWAMMLLGFGLAGGVMRSAKRKERLTVSYA